MHATSSVRTLVLALFVVALSSGCTCNSSRENDTRGPSENIEVSERAVEYQAAAPAPAPRPAGPCTPEAARLVARAYVLSTPLGDGNLSMSVTAQSEFARFAIANKAALQPSSSHKEPSTT